MHVIILIIHLLLNASDIFFSLSSEKWYVLPVSVSGVSILHRICVLYEDIKCEINLKNRKYNERLAFLEIHSIIEFVSFSPQQVNL